MQRSPARRWYLPSDTDSRNCFMNRSETDGKKKREKGGEDGHRQWTREREEQRSRVEGPGESRRSPRG